MPFATEYIGIDKKLAAQLLMLIATCKQTFNNISAIIFVNLINLSISK